MCFLPFPYISFPPYLFLVFFVFSTGLALALWRFRDVVDATAWIQEVVTAAAALQKADTVKFDPLDGLDLHSDDEGDDIDDDDDDDEEEAEAEKEKGKRRSVVEGKAIDSRAHPVCCDDIFHLSHEINHFICV